MQTWSSPTWKPLVLLLLLCAVILFVAVLLSAFRHQVGHGVGSRINGVHVNTDFNGVGNPDRKPGDPDFRAGMTTGFWGDLLGPMTTWPLAIASTIWLCRFKEPSWAALIMATSTIIVAFKVDILELGRGNGYGLRQGRDHGPVIVSGLCITLGKTLVQVGDG